MTEEQKAFIRDHLHDPDWTDSALAKHLGLNTETVKKFRVRSGLKKNYKGKVDINKTKNVTKELLLSGSLTDEERLIAWKTFFKSTDRYRKLKGSVESNDSELTIKDLEYFMSQWAKYCMQFEDMTATEENLLENIIIYEIRLADNRRAFREIQETEDKLRAQLLGADGQIKELDLENEADRWMYEYIESHKQRRLDLNKQLQELTRVYNELMKDMNATRAAREAKHDIGKDTFLSLIKMMNSRDHRRIIGKYNELMKLAIEKKANELKKPYEFADGTVGNILLTGSDIEKDKKSEK